MYLSFCFLVISKTFEFRLVGKEWSDDLLDPTSQKYTELKDEIMKGVGQFQMMLLFTILSRQFEVY